MRVRVCACVRVCVCACVLLYVTFLFSLEPSHCDPGMELIPRNEDSSISYSIILSYGRDTILLNKTKMFLIGVVSPEL